MEFSSRLVGHEALDDRVHEAHDGGDIDEKLLLEQFGVVLAEDADRLGGRRLDHGRLAEEREGAVVMHLGYFVRVIGRRDGLRCGGEGQVAEGQFH